MKVENKLQKGYSIIDNNVILNPNISLEAIGLYTYLVSRPPNWNFNFGGIQKQLNIGKKKLQRLVKELENENIIIRYCINEKGNFNRIWIINPDEKDLQKQNKNIKSKINKIEINKEENIDLNKQDKLLKEAENFIKYWNTIFNSNFRLTNTLIKEYIKKRKEYGKENIEKGFKEYIKNKQERDKENWKSKFLLTPLKFLKQSNGIVSYI